MRIRTKFFLVFFVTSLLPLLFLTYVSFAAAKQMLVKATEDKLATIADFQVSRIREIGLNPQRLKEVSSNHIGLWSTGEVIIAKRGKNGEIEYINPRRFENLKRRRSALMKAALERREEFYPELIGYRGVPVTAVTRYLPDLGLGVIAQVDSAEAFKSVNILRDKILIFSFIFLLLVVMIVLFFVHSITAPVLNLLSVAKEVRDGDLSRRASLQTNDEIGDLTNSINAMIVSLQDSHKELENKVQVRTKDLLEQTNRALVLMEKAEKAEEKLAVVNENLNISNKELAQFAYIASHDLKAPLRGIGSLSDWIYKDYAEKLDAKGRELLDLMKGRVARMSSLIDGILQYSRLGRDNSVKEQVDLNLLLKQVVDLLAVSDEIQITIMPDLPSVLGVPVQLAQVFQNLISNAIRFVDKKQKLIHVGFKEQESDWIFFVRDNGPGIPEEYFDRIFQIFQTLAPRDKIESTGIGLSIVKKVVELHGGRVWVESHLESGATFYFTLPKKKENQWNKTTKSYWQKTIG